MASAATATRRGKWKWSEESYANGLVNAFKAGLLPAAEGLTLRTFLAESLGCDPMRVTKKFSGTDSIGKLLYVAKTARADSSRSAADAALLEQSVAQTDQELSHLRSEFLNSLSVQRQLQSSSSAGAGASFRGLVSGPVSPAPASEGGASRSDLHSLDSASASSAFSEDSSRGNNCGQAAVPRSLSRSGFSMSINSHLSQAVSDALQAAATATKAGSDSSSSSGHQHHRNVPLHRRPPTRGPPHPLPASVYSEEELGGGDCEAAAVASMLVLMNKRPRLET